MLAGRDAVTVADGEMAARAAADWRARFQQYSRPQVPCVRAPEGICVPCWQNLGAYGLKTWRSHPLEVLRIDLAVTDEQGRVTLAKELIALADLVAAHPAEFRELIEREAVLSALAAI